jgi:hypothetical protein
LAHIHRGIKRPCYDTALHRPLVFFTQSPDFPYEIQQWAPGHLTLDAELSQPDTLVIQQSLYPGWSATVDGSSSDITPWCGHIISLPLSSGFHQVEFQFQRRDIVALWIYQALITFGLLLWVFLLTILGRKSPFT